MWAVMPQVMMQRVQWAEKLGPLAVDGGRPPCASPLRSAVGAVCNVKPSLLMHAISSSSVSRSATSAPAAVDATAAAAAAASIGHRVAARAGVQALANLLLGGGAATVTTGMGCAFLPPVCLAAAGRPP